jgi:hypothetical protein
MLITWCVEDVGLLCTAFSLELDHLADWFDQFYTAAFNPAPCDRPTDSRDFWP